MTPDNVERERSDDIEDQPVGVFSTADADVGGGLDEVQTPPDDPKVIDDYGTTATEEREGEPLSSRLDREEAETTDGLIEAPADGAPAGQLVEPGSEEVDSVDKTPESIAREAGSKAGGRSAEETALHLED